MATVYSVRLRREWRNDLGAYGSIVLVDRLPQWWWQPDAAEQLDQLAQQEGWLARAGTLADAVTLAELFSLQYTAPVVLGINALYEAEGIE